MIIPPLFMKLVFNRYLAAILAFFFGYFLVTSWLYEAVSGEDWVPEFLCATEGEEARASPAPEQQKTCGATLWGRVLIGALLGLVAMVVVGRLRRLFG